MCTGFAGRSECPKKYGAAAVLGRVLYMLLSSIPTKKGVHGRNKGVYGYVQVQNYRTSNLRFVLDCGKHDHACKERGAMQTQVKRAEPGITAYPRASDRRRVVEQKQEEPFSMSRAS